jgi:hypothetical protein
MQRPQLEHIIRTGREKDLTFVRLLLKHRLAKSEILRQRLAGTAISPEQTKLCLSRLQRLSV